MEAEVLIAVRILFIVAALAPLTLVVRYRWIDVPLRKREIQKALDAASKGRAGTARAVAQKPLERDPYVGDLGKTFDRVHDVRRYVLPLAALQVITTASAWIGYSWVESWWASSSPPPARVPAVVIMALAGGLVWGLYQILNRTRHGELTPSDLYEIDLGILAAVPIGYAFSLITAELDGVRSFMAFAASAFPLSDVSRFARQQATRRMLESRGTQEPRPTERHLGTAIDGVSDEALARLAELRIFTALDMAYSDPVKIMVQTGYPLRVIIDWLDQAIWSLYVGDLKSAFNNQGIRCSLDVVEFVDLHLRDKHGSKVDQPQGLHQAAVEAVALKLGTTSGLTQDLFFRIYNDPQVSILRELWYTGGAPAELKAFNA